MTSATSALGTVARGMAEQQPAAGPSTRVLYVTPEISDFVKAGGLGDVSAAVLYVTPEISDFVKAGGLGDVSAALPRALRARCDVRVLLPGYRQVLQRCRRLRWSNDWTAWRAYHRVILPKFACLMGWSPALSLLGRPLHTRTSTRARPEACGRGVLADGATGTSRVNIC